MATEFSAALSGSVTLTNSNKTVSSSGSWTLGRANHSKYLQEANHCVEFYVDDAITDLMVGFMPPSSNSVQAHLSGGLLYWSRGSIWSPAGNTTPGVASWGAAGDVITVIAKNGKMYVAKNGVLQNGANLSAETGFVLSGLSGLYYPAVSMWESGKRVTIRANTAAIAHKPSGIKVWDTSGGISVTLKAPNGSAIASTAVRYALLDSAVVSSASAVIMQGTATTTAEGVLEAIVASPPASATPRGLLISTSDGTEGVQSQAHFSPYVMAETEN